MQDCLENFHNVSAVNVINAEREKETTKGKIKKQKMLKNLLAVIHDGPGLQIPKISKT